MSVRGHFCKQHIIEYGVAYGMDELESCLDSIERYCDEHLENHCLLNWYGNEIVEIHIEDLESIDTEDLRQYLSQEQQEILDSLLEYAKMPQNTKDGFIRIEFF